MPDVKETVKFIKKVPLFATLNNRQLEHLAKRFVDRSYKTGDEIVSQGQGGEGFFIFTSGKAQVTRQRTDGTSLVVNEIGPTDFLGELALLDDGLRTASAIATEPVSCIVLTRWDFISVLKEDADMAIAILQELARRFRRALDAM